MISGEQARAIVFAVIMITSVVGVGASGVAGQDGATGEDVTIGSTAISAEFIGTVADPGTITLEATEITGSPESVTFTLGAEPVATAAVSNGTAEVTIDSTVIDLEPGTTVDVGVEDYAVESPAAVEIVHEVRDLNEGFNLVSVPQAASLSIQDVGAVNQWNPTTETYETITDNEFDDVEALHNGLYLSAMSDTARLGFTFTNAVPEPGTATLEPGWNFVGSNFAIDSIDAGDTRTLDEDLINVDADAVDAFSADFSRSLSSDSTIEAYDSYWVFNGDSSPLERAIVTPPYDSQSREDVLGIPETTLTFRDQVTNATRLGANATEPGVTVEDVSSDVDSTVVITYRDDGEQVIAGVEAFAADELNETTVTVAVNDTGGFPGVHTAHLIESDGLSGNYTPGETVSEITTDAVLDQSLATVGDASVSLDTQSVENSASEVTVAASNVQPQTEYVIVVHEVTEDDSVGAPVGSSEALTGEQAEIPVELDNTTVTNTTEFVAMLHYTAPGEPFGPPIPNSDATDGFVSGNVADSGEVAVFNAEGAELSFDSQAVGIDADGNAVVYTDEISTATQVEQEDVSNPTEDFVVLYEGSNLTVESIVDVERVEDAQDGELLLEAEDAAPGTHSVEIFEDTRSSVDPTANTSDSELIENTRLPETGDNGGTAQSYILLLEDEVTPQVTADREETIAQFQSQAEEAQQPVVEDLRAIDASVDSQFWLINGLVTTAPDDVTAADLRAIDGVEAVVENVEAQHPQPVPSGSSSSAPQIGTEQNHDVTYGLEQIDVPGFEEKYDTQGEGTRVAIIDDGLNPDHPDINVTLGVNVIDGQVVVPEDGLTREFGSAHGEHVAGTAVGTADPAREEVPRYSVAPGADLLKANIWPGNPTLADTIRAVQWSVEEDADVTSMSLGFGQGAGENIVSTTMAQTISNANAAGTLVIGSAGNEASGVTGGPVTSPGAEFNSLSVGATDSQGGVAGFSSGTTVTPNDVLLVEEQGQYPATFPRSYVKPDVTAPGVNVLSTGPLGGNEFDGEPSYSYSSGTSMAAPHVAGAAALVQSATATEHSPQTIKNALAESATKPTTQFGNQSERDIRYGTGIINVTAATMALNETTAVEGDVTAASGEPLTGAKVTTDTGVVSATTDGNFEFVVTDADEPFTVTADAFGYTAATTTVSPNTSDPVTFELEPETTAEVVTGQPAFAEYTDEFTMVVDVRNLEEYTVELADAEGVTADDISVSVGEEPVTIGEPANFSGLDANGVPVTVSIDGNFSENDQFALEHTFAGASEPVTTTTGPTTLTETIGPAAFELSNFTAPSGEELETAEPYAVEVTVTNTGQQAGEAELQWFLSSFGLAGSNPTVTLAPGESTTQGLNFGEQNFGAAFGVPVTVLQGFEASPSGENATGDVTTAPFTIGSGQIALTDPLGQSRAVGDTQSVVTANVTLPDQAFNGSTSSVQVSTSSVQPTDTEYVIVVHENTEGLPVLGNSETLTGTQTDITVNLNESISNGTDVVAMLHFAAEDSAFGAPIQAYDGEAGQLQPVTDTATVSEPVGPVALDSVSSLLNADNEPLMDDSTVAIAAESSATNSDEDGNGDAVSYPDGTDIPVLAVDDTVVGVTGPFVTSNTDFQNYANEEIMLNVYDRLLGGSGTIVHDEGHGQFYTLTENGGDDYQTFAAYVESNGYTYTNSTNITADLDTADAVVITSPGDAYSDAELSALADFAADGGVVVLHDQSDFRNFDATDNHNEIAAALNASFRFNDDQVIDSEQNTGAQFVPVTDNYNVETFPTLFSDRDGLGKNLSVNETYEVDVVDVADGDTVDVQFDDGTTDTVRIVGIDTPETGDTDERLQEYEGIDDGPALRAEGDNATDYAVEQLAGETVTLRFDENEGLRGNFGRLLGFLELPDGSVYNEEVIADGWARVYDSGFAQHDDYWELEQSARADNAGMWGISDPAATSEVGDSSFDEIAVPNSVAVSGETVAVSSEAGEPLVALDTDANVAVVGGPLIEEGLEADEDGPGIDGYGNYPFLTNTIDAVSETDSGPVVIDGGHGQFASDAAVSAEDAAYYLRYLEGQSSANESFIGFEATNNIATDPGPDLLTESGEPAARALIISAPSSELTADERATVAAFADAGGAVVLLGSADTPNATANLEPVLSELNASVGFTETAVTDAENSLADDPAVITTSNVSGSYTELFTPYTDDTTNTTSAASMSPAMPSLTGAAADEGIISTIDDTPVRAPVSVLRVSGGGV